MVRYSLGVVKVVGRRRMEERNVQQGQRRDTREDSLVVVSVPQPEGSEQGIAADELAAAVV